MKRTNILYCLGLCIIPAVFLLERAAGRSEEPDTVAAAGGAKAMEGAKTTGLAKVVSLAEAFKATLSKDQQALLQLTYSKKNAIRWSNFPQQFSNPNRIGISLGALDPAQLAAAKVLMASALSQDSANEGYGELLGVLYADDYLGKATGKPETFGSGNYYIAFLGTPSTTELWELQYGGHHFAFSNTYNKGAITGATPSFRGVEPMSPINANGQTYQPMEQEKEAFADILSSLSADEKATAKLTSTFSDVLLGPGEDGNFPTQKSGVKISGLMSAQQQLVIRAIRLYVNDLDSVTAANIMKKYLAQLPDTYLAFSGTGTMGQVADYIRLDGPGIWIEYAVQPSRDFANTTHPHSIWRDHQSDYGGN